MHLVTLLALSLTCQKASAWWNKPDSRDEDYQDSICPFINKGTPISGNDPTIPDIYTYNDALSDLNINSVFQDIIDLLVDSQDCWPADTLNGDTNYGALFIRLAWHCSGTYRSTDGAGGCAGGRQRFPPEASWGDNTNLDKGRALLYPIKEKYGDALSWGDLFVFAGTASIYALGGPVNEICAGRIDEYDGKNSYILHERCDHEGNCERDNEIIAETGIGRIYVDPEGVNGDPDPAKSAKQIREIFRRMDMNDIETVALIGSGHTFGKTHGACPFGPGPNPDEQPRNPWPGNCGSGKGKDTYTMGFEGQWTTYPFRWDNEYFRLLRDDGMEYELVKSPGKKWQWRHPKYKLMMLTTDLALVYDKDYRRIVEDFADDLDYLDREFAEVWEKLTTNGGEWAKNKFCINAYDLDLDLDEMPNSKNY